MKTIQISTTDTQGGAARAAYRLHKGLIQIGENDIMVTMTKMSSDPNISKVDTVTTNEAISQEIESYNVIQDQYINKNRTDMSNTIFSLPYYGYNLTNLDVVKAADIINLHWINHFQSLTSLDKLLSMNKPVVWTLHDQWPFTGGCHYTAGCDKYKDNCSYCPQLADDPFCLPSAVLKDKLQLFDGANITVVTPSKWLGECAKKSKLFKGKRIEVIPYSLETDLFRPIPKIQAKQKYCIEPDTVTILFGAEYGQEKRKGLTELFQTLEICSQISEFQRLLENNKIRFLCFGHSDTNLNLGGLPVVQLGYIDSDDKMCLAYSAADMFVLPSLEDNLPNTMLESMSCSTPVIAFQTGGIPDAVIHNITGKIVQHGNVHQMADSIVSLILNKKERTILGENGRKRMTEEYDLKIQSRNYLALYEELLSSKKNFTTKGPNKELVMELHNNEKHEPELSKDRYIYADLNVGDNFREVYYQVLSMALQKKLQERDRPLINHIESLENKLAILRRIPGYRFIVKLAKQLRLY